MSRRRYGSRPTVKEYRRGNGELIIYTVGDWKQWVKSTTPVEVEQ